MYYAGTFEETENPDVSWPHRHDFYSLVWFTHSVGINVIDFEEYEIKPDRLFLMHPKQVHNWSYSKNSKGYILVFDKHFIKEFPLQLLRTVFFDVSLKDRQLLQPLFENLIEESNRNDKLSETMVASGVSFLVLQLKRLAACQKPNEKVHSETMLKFSELIAHSISENLSVKAYAERLHITVDKLNEICKKSYGQTPKTIILNKKITEAKRLLYFTDLSVKEIAFQLGFEDSSYFSRLFKQKTKHSPTHFKNT